MSNEQEKGKECVRGFTGAGGQGVRHISACQC